VRAIGVLMVIVAAATSVTAQGQGTLVSIRGGTAINHLAPSKSGESVLGQAGIGTAGGQLRLNGTLDVLSEKVTLTLYDIGSESHWENQLRLANIAGAILTDDDDHWRTTLGSDIYIHSPLQNRGSVLQRAGVAQMEFWGYIGAPLYKTVINSQSPLKAVTNYYYAGIVLAYLDGSNQIVSGPTNRILVLHEDGGDDQDFDDYVGILVASAAPASSGGAVDLRIAARPAAAPIQALVNVTDPNALPISGLGAAAFVLRVDGDVTSATFALPPSQSSSRRTSVVLALDYGDTTSAGARTAMQNAAVDFLDSMRSGDFAAIVKSNASGPTKASVVQPFTPIATGRQLLIDAVTSPYPGAGTNPYDAVTLSVEQFAAASLPDGPKAVVFASDGGKSTSTADLNAVVSAANAAGIPLFTVGVGQPGDRGGQVLTLLANQTAGRYFRAATNQQIADAYTDIFERLDSEYVLQLPPSAVTGCGTHTLQVQATFSGNTLSSTEAFTRCAPTFVPDLGRKTLATATTALAGLGLAVGDTTQRPSATVPAGGVISQSPWPGTDVAGLTFVHVVISTGGPAPITVPSVVGVPLSPASSAILDASLVVGSITEQPSVTVTPGTVISQTPAAGAAATAGASVNLVISSGPSVPNVLNLPFQAAATAITGASLVVGTVTQQSSTTVQAGRVISQNPVTPTQVAVGSPVNLVIASGASTTVPTVTGMPQAAATTAITSASLLVGTVTQQSSSSVPAGSVISQTPNGGSQAAVGTSVNLVVSNGPAPVAVPNVTGLTQAAATTAITTASLVVGTVTQQSSSTVAAGNVISQNPTAGQSVAPGTAVNLVVSTGPAQVSVPSVAGLTQSAATLTITESSLIVGTVTQQSSSTVASGNVISQNPAAGQSVAPGSAVNLVVSSGPAPVSVPSVTGLTQAAAASAITGASLVVGVVAQQSSSTVPSGNVISQSPAAGQSVAQGTAVNLVVSSGPATVAVPSVTGLAQAAAASAITGASLIVGAVTQQSSSTVESGNVISQNPVAGQSVALGTAVNLVVSSGAVVLPAPTVSLTANPTGIAAGESSTLTWSSANATACAASGGWSGSLPTSGADTRSVSTTTEFTLTCTGPGGTAASAATVTVAALTPPTVSLSANPTSIVAGQTSTLTWSTTHATACTASGGWSGSLATSGSDTRALSTATAFTLTCTGPAGTVAQTVEVSVTPPTGGGDGGGGAIDYLALALLLLCVGVNTCRLRRIPR
jgi:beta-lactam-binding protein with PASTA domain